jgi:thiol-disulfide isomerase/thioredoxin
MKKSHVIIGILAIFAVAVFFIVQKGAEEPPVPEVGLNAKEGTEKGKLAKDFSLTTIERNVAKLSDYKGKYVLFASMATWCTPCQIEAQNVKKAQENFEHLPLTVMQIDVDQRETAQDLERFRQQFGKEDWVMGIDDGSITRLYNIRSFDTTLIVDPEGVIVYRDNGFPIDTKTLEALIIKGESSSLILGSTHEHANISVILGGKEIDFSQPKYQLRSSFVHFEGGGGREVHVHAEGVTLKYLLESLGWETAEGCLKTDTGTYCSGSVVANGNHSDINHEIKESENISVEYNQ